MRTIPGDKFAFISDLHGRDPTKIIKKIEGKVDLVILGGDIPDHTQRNFVSILKKFLKLNIPIVLFPGSHENGEMYKAALSKIKDKHLIDAVKKNNRRIFFGDMDLIIAPGSDVIGRGTKSYNGGTYWLREKKLPGMIRAANKRIREIKYGRKATMLFLEDTIAQIKKKRTKPASKILLAHIPYECKTKKGIDVAHFGRTTKEFTLKKSDMKKVGTTEKNIPKGAIMLLKQALILKKKKYPVQTLKKNVGNEMLNKLMKRYRITKFICGHIHECGRRAISKTEQQRKPKTFYKNISINSAHGCTIITCKKEKIAYEFISG